MKLMVCFMLIILGASTGVTVAMNMTERVALLKKLQRFIKMIGEMTGYNPKNLDEMVEDIKNSSEFLDCMPINELDCSVIKEKGFNIAWEKSLHKNSGYLKMSDRELLSAFGESLGRSDCDTQRRHCDYYAEKMEQVIMNADEEAKKKGRLYVSLGTMAGVFAVIMFI